MANAELNVGDQVPKFSLLGSDGKSYGPEVYKDKQVMVIAWFPKAFTGGWRRECISLREGGKALKSLNVAYFAASCDPQEKNKRFAEELELDYPILSDPDRKVAGLFGVVNKERTFPQRWTFYIGKDGRVLHVDKSVNVDSHGADMAKQLKKLGVD